MFFCARSNLLSREWNKRKRNFHQRKRGDFDKKFDEPLPRVQSLITNDEYFKIIESLKPAAATDQRK